jgi:glutaminyl-tRNA synthetase
LLSKRRLLRLVNEGYVTGWDDPRMPTLAGFRRRGYTPEAIRNLIERVGVAKKDTSLVDIALMQSIIREDLNQRAPRVMAVLDPIKLVIENYPEGQIEELEAENNPEDESAGSRVIPFSRELYIEREDFMEDPPKKFFRLGPGREVRLKHAYYVTCTDVVKNDSGQITEVRCTYDPQSRGGWTDDGRKVRGTLHWVSAAHAIEAEVRLYDHLFAAPTPDEADDYIEHINPDSLQIIPSAKVEPTLEGATSGDRYQFLRMGYFVVDPDSAPGRLVFNRTLPLRDTWAKIQQSQT